MLKTISVKKTRGCDFMMTTTGLPPHLQKYIVEQDYDKYTALNHAVWRYVLRQLKSYLTENAHHHYLQGLEKTGIDIEQIPRIEDISTHLEKFGWRALPVSGFIPPAAFMELQSLGVLPIASYMRSIDHLLYTPAPDIVHEAAGHAPFIADAEYSEYLKQYAQVAKKAIISKEDLEIYGAIRELSDIKENPNSTQTEILAAEMRLSKISKSVSFVSEAAELSRMNWWTAEYGLIGDLHSPKIFGAGLLSSVGESKLCLSDKVKKIPLTLNCIKQTYDITEPQPQLFVAKDFRHLSLVLEELAQTMSYNIGGVKALECAKKAESINTTQFENKIQISGVLKKYYLDADEQIAYLQFVGPTQLNYNNKEIKGHGNKYHSQGYGTPIGEILNFNLDHLKLGDTTTLKYKSGVLVSGILKNILSLGQGAVILSFEKATAEYKNEKLFLPEWGLYDVILANTVTSVFSGPADREQFGETEDFVAARVTKPHYSDEQNKIFSYFQEIRDLRKLGAANEKNITDLFNKFKEAAPNEWLLFIELVELCVKLDINYQKIEAHLLTLKQKTLISEGLKLAHAKY
ncbi:MAG: aromatic amino acid hydroxylase [Bdellovibrionota bacterium]